GTGYKRILVLLYCIQAHGRRPAIERMEMRLKLGAVDKFISVHLNQRACRDRRSIIGAVVADVVSGKADIGTAEILGNDPADLLPYTIVIEQASTGEVVRREIVSQRLDFIVESLANQLIVGESDGLVRSVDNLSNLDENVVTLGSLDCAYHDAILDYHPKADVPVKKPLFLSEDQLTALFEWIILRAPKSVILSEWLRVQNGKPAHGYDDPDRALVKGVWAQILRDPRFNEIAVVRRFYAWAPERGLYDLEFYVYMLNGNLSLDRTQQRVVDAAIALLRVMPQTADEPSPLRDLREAMARKIVSAEAEYVIDPVAVNISPGEIIAHNFEAALSALRWAGRRRDGSCNVGRESDKIYTAFIMSVHGALLAKGRFVPLPGSSDKNFVISPSQHDDIIKSWRELNARGGQLELTPAFESAARLRRLHDRPAGDAEIRVDNLNELADLVFDHVKTMVRQSMDASTDFLRLMRGVHNDKADLKYLALFGINGRLCRGE
ncbi:MAG: hypothetical protein WCJ64_15955, partial [Rhodospirillaceae bacterium]